ncbi:ATP-binding protein [Desulfobacterales bacterium HSG16]|nr:ATP-binding protein [Desulfobacterales bacterium HSG16]
MRFFNTAGPNRSKDHYCLPPLTRIELEEILSLIEQKKYFVLHAPRQTGKTSVLLALMEHLNNEGKYHCLYFNAEVGQSAREDVKRGIRAILSEMSSMARDTLNDNFLEGIWADVLEKRGEDVALNEVLTLWAEATDKPIVILIDEIDSLVGDTLISVLRQLRAGYPKRSALFPQSAVLCGVRDVRDYRIHSNRDKAVITGGSAFNIKAESLRLGDFNYEEIKTLYLQHTEETGQKFEEEVLKKIWEMSCGQPWLVNALGYEACFRMKESRNRKNCITLDTITKARELLIQKRETHIDQLMDKLREDRVRKVIEPLLTGVDDPKLIPTDDILYVEDLGLIKLRGQLEIANPIYQEIIPRELTYSTQLTISHSSAWYIRPDGSLDMDKLMTAFQEFFREHSESWVERFDYKEAGPQLLMQAFLQRVNSGGNVEREYGLGRKRTDLLVTWPVKSDENGKSGSDSQKIVIELKIKYGSRKTTISKGVEQTWMYMDKCGADDGHLVIFDRDLKKSWEKKVYRHEETYQGKRIKVWGM